MRHRVITAFGAAALGLLALGASNASAVPPTISGTAYSTVRTDSVILEVAINPNGKATKYRFEYGSGDCEANPCTAIPAPDAALPLPPASTPELVKAKVEGLSPATQYHFRLIAKSTGTGGGETVGPDVTFTTYHPSPTFGACPNDAFRTNQPSAKLPDCRAYEQASPVDKNSGDARGTVSFVRASVGGDRVSFVGTTNLLGSGGGQELPIYLSSRNGANWTTDGILPPAAIGEEAFVIGWTSDFSQVFDIANRFSNVSDATLVSRSSADGSITTIVPYGSGLRGSARIAGASAGGSEVFFEATDKLSTVPAALEGKPNLYLWNRDGGTLSLAGVFNDGTAPPEGAFAGPYAWSHNNPNIGGALSGFYTQDTHAIAADGSVYFTAAKTGQLYLRKNPTKAQSPLNGEGECTDPALACTLHLSASRKTDGLGPGGTDAAGARPAAFMAATPDGSKAFFASSEKLTNGATTGTEPTGSPGIAHADIEGNGANLNFLPTHASGVALDATYLYWANPQAGTIGRAKLNGEEVKEAFITGAGNPQYVTVDDEYVYWTNAADGKDHHGTIGRAKLDGSEPKLDFIADTSNPQGIDVDASHIYWVNDGERHGNCAGQELPGCEHGTNVIGRADIDGSNPDRLFIEFSNASEDNHAIAVDGSHIYVTQSFLGNKGPNGYFGFVNRYNLDGSDAGGTGSGEGAEPRGIALDGGHVYWALEGASTIARANLDFSEKNVEFIKEAGHPHGLALNATDIYWSANQEVLPNPGNDLYRYDVGSGQLTDLTPYPAAENGAEVQGILGTSDDGSYVYLVANADLDGAGPATGGDCHGSFGGGFFGECSIYLAHEGTFTFVARLSAAADSDNWRPLPNGVAGGKTARVSPDGRTLLFSAKENLTSYDSKGIKQLYRYRVGDPAPTCVSCNPTEGPPAFLFQSRGPGFGSITLSFVIPFESNVVLSRNLSADGNRVFFETTEALVAADTNGEGGCPLIGPAVGKYLPCLDVYEWEAKGTGSCEEDIQGGGCLYLLSSGDSTDASYIADASASGNDIFLLTRSQLVGQDEDELYDVYDASVGGGLASQNEVPPVPCEGEACKGAAATVPESQSAGTATFAGPPNPKAHKPKARCPKSKREVRAKGKTRCVSKHHHKRNANSKRRASR